MGKVKFKTQVVHSRNSAAWDVVNKTLGGKFKLASIPYVGSEDPEVAEEQILEAMKHAEFISACFNRWDGVQPIKFC